MKLLARSVLGSSVVAQAARGTFRPGQGQEVAVGKETAVELLALAPGGEGLHSVWHQRVGGTVRQLAVLPWNAALRGGGPEELEGRDLLAVLSDSGTLSFLAFSSSLHRFVAVSHVKIGSEGFGLQEMGQHLAVERHGWAVAVAAFRDRLTLFPACQTQQGEGIEQLVSCEGATYSERERADTQAGCSGASMPTRWSTVWSLVFLDNSAGQPSDAPPSHLRLAAAVHRAGSAYSEVQLLEWDRSAAAIHCLMRVPLPHEEQFGLLTQVLPVPGNSSCMVAIGSKALMLLELEASDPSQCDGITGLQRNPCASGASQGAEAEVGRMPSAPSAPSRLPSVPGAPRIVELFPLPLHLPSRGKQASMDSVDSSGLGGRWRSPGASRHPEDDGRPRGSRDFGTSPRPLSSSGRRISSRASTPRSELPEEAPRCQIITGASWVCQLGGT
eukprot:jgi/Tetstr1/449740/TSEL_036807.t1